MSAHVPDAPEPEDVERMDWEAFIRLWIHIDVDKIEDISKRAKADKLNASEVTKLDEYLSRSLSAYRSGGEDESAALCEAAWERANMLNLYLTNRLSIGTGEIVRRSAKKGGQVKANAALASSAQYQAIADEIWAANPRISKSGVAERIAEKFIQSYLDERGLGRESKSKAMKTLQDTIRRKIKKPS
ncbi:hypothetical protein [Stenotrophomonas nematodicola]|uniref:hypothetical protein n=1 Tax=Stenotrophomonas nematodicola TaxID=2656746 RepID=UPI001290C6F1|nr:hypothetical protein [Stenotrophomonas nematodicola]